MKERCAFSRLTGVPHRVAGLHEAKEDVPSSLFGSGERGHHESLLWNHSHLVEYTLPALTALATKKKETISPYSAVFDQVNLSWHQK